MPSSPSGVAPADAPLSLGIDIGGTFTDLVVLDPSNGNAAIWKESTTQDDPARGIMLGLAKLVERSGIALERIGRVIHATTLFTNALIERKGAPTGLMTTAAFADVLEIAASENTSCMICSLNCRRLSCRVPGVARFRNVWRPPAASRFRST